MSASAVPATVERAEAATPESRSLRILFVTSRFPHPPLKGDQLRAWHQIRLLGQRHRVTLVYLARGPAASHDALAGSCERIVAVPFGPAGHGRGASSGASSPRCPFQASLYETPAMRAALRRLAAQPFDLVHVQLARMAPYLEEGVCPRPWVVDLVDALSLGMERRGREEWGPARLVARIGDGEGFGDTNGSSWPPRTGPWSSLVETARRSATCPASASSRTPSTSRPSPSRARTREPATVVFSGNMGYFPNVNAAVWFAREVLPRVRQALPETRFLIVGARPARAVRGLAKDPG